MPDAPSASVAALPRWFLVIASLAIVFHLVAVLSGALAAPSGPWPNQEEAGSAPGPSFAASLNNAIRPNYSSWLKLTHNYHFPSNRPNINGINFEVVLKDADGNEIKTIKFPDAEANAVVRSLQQDLARWLEEDVPVPPPQGERIAAPGQELPSLQIWNALDNRRGRLEKMPEHLISRDRPVFRPSDWSLLLARSYSRFLCRKYGADSAEVVRHIREPIPPSVLADEDLHPDDLEDSISYYGKLPK
jgi:hypothetical protein